MGQSWSSPASAPLIEDYETNNTFQHAKSGFYYRMLRKDGKFIQQRYLLDRNQQPIHVHEEEVTYVVGSGNHARYYLRHHPNGVITQLPVTWYSQALGHRRNDGEGAHHQSNVGEEVRPVPNPNSVIRSSRKT